MKRYVLDSWALLAWLDGEAPADAEVQSIMDAAAAGRVELWMSLMNLGEVFYATARKSGTGKAREDRKILLGAPIRFVGIDDELVWEAAEIKATHVVAFADAFAAALTVRLKATLITGDPEFDALAEKGLFEVKRLARKGRRRG